MILGSIDLDRAQGVDLVVRLRERREIDQIVFCNRTSADARVRLWIVPRFETDETGQVTTPVREDRHAWLYDAKLDAHGTVGVPQRIGQLEPGDCIHAYTTIANVSVNVTGR